MKKSIKTIAALLIIGTAFTACTQSKEVRYPYTSKESKSFAFDSLITVQSDTGILTFKSDVVRGPLGTLLQSTTAYSLDTGNTLRGFSQIYIKRSEHDALDSILIYHTSGKIFQNILYASQKLIVTSDRRQGFYFVEETGEYFWQYAGEFCVHLLNDNGNWYGKYITESSVDVAEPGTHRELREKYLFPKLNEKASNLDIYAAIQNYTEPFILEEATDSTLVFRMFDFKYLRSSQFMEKNNVTLEDMYLMSPLALIEKLQKQIQTIEVEIKHSTPVKVSMYPKYALSVHYDNVVDRFHDWGIRKKAFEQKQKEAGENAATVSTNVDGRYSSESSQATYRLTVSNGRWSFSTAIKISGIASTDYSSGIERNGTLYSGAAAVGSVNGSCAQVGSSPRMCK
ncbi:hypothetical protein N8883_01110 [Bacteroidia bacterium]|nr:hypothetical protein [Bacteroidia bacterium]